ncbi:MAG: SNF2-related protein [Promicromonosporaceae bacterium]|nr:SNF2-related protein [Promicromonosporaceae bacterium]
MSGLPDFATNISSGEEAGETVAMQVNRLLELKRQNRVEAPPVAIATAYINPAGFALLADELEQAPRVRLLLGAEPDAEKVRAVGQGDADQDVRREAALSDHQRWLEAERDAMGFERKPSAEAKRMVRWLEEHDVEVRRYAQGFLHGKTYIVEDGAEPAALAGSSNMTFAGLALNAELNLGTGGGTHAARKVSEWFERFWAASDEYDLAELYGRLWDPHSPWAVYLRMLWELYGAHIDEEEPSRSSGLGLTQFQTDGVARMERLLEEHGGVLVADEVGLGKTYLAGEVIHKTSMINRQRVLIIAPAALVKSMWEPFLKEKGFSRRVTVYSYEVARNRLDPADPDHVEFMRDVDDASLIVVDEAHNLRNSGAQRSAAVDSIITVGVNPKKVVLLTATPVNNSLTDLETLIRYFIRDDARFASAGIPSIKAYIQRARDIDPANLTPEHLFDLMDQVAVRRTRRFVTEFYSRDLITGPDGQLTTLKFPQPKPRRIDYQVGLAGLALIDAMIYALGDPTDPTVPNAWAERVEDPDRLMLARYMSSMYTLDNDLAKYQVSNAGLLRSGLLKRLESSTYALHASLGRMLASHEAFLTALDQGYVLAGDALAEWASSDSDDLDALVAELDSDAQVDSASRYHLDALRADVVSDMELLRRLQDMVADVVNEADGGAGPKAAMLIEELARIADEARSIDPRGVSSADRRKVVIFSAFADTVIPIHAAVVEAIDNAPAGSALADYRGRVAPPIMGTYKSTHLHGESGGVDQGGRATTIAGFAPKTAGPRNDAGQPAAEDLYDILFTTDVLSEGVNLQQAGQMINFDLPWNPMRIVQRHGRIDRIGSAHDYVQLGLFFPAERLDEYLRLEEVLETKLALADAAVGVGEVLPGRGPGHEINLNDTSVIEDFTTLLATGGSSASLSGEEYRRRLFRAFDIDTALKAEAQQLPYGSGSGYESPNINGNVYVFCIRVGDSGKPWFRYVVADDDWAVPRGDGGQPQVYDDTLTALRVADPGSADQARWLPEEVYDKAFDAWQIAQQSVWQQRDAMTDPNAFLPDLPKSFRDAHVLIVQSGGYLGREQQTSLLRRLRSVPPVKVARAMRSALNDGRTAEEMITLATKVLDDAGIVEPPPAKPLPPIELHEVRLIAWQAVHGTRAK